MHFRGNEGLQAETSKMFTLLLEKNGGTSPASSQGDCMNDIPIVEDFVDVRMFLYDIDFVDGAMSGEFARKSAGKHSNSPNPTLQKSHLLCIQSQCFF